MKNSLRASTWIFLVQLFLITAYSIGVYAVYVKVLSKDDPYVIYTFLAWFGLMCAISRANQSVMDMEWRERNLQYQLTLARGDEPGNDDAKRLVLHVIDQAFPAKIKNA